MPEIIQITKEEKGLKHMKTKDLVLCAMFVALIAVGAFIKIPVPVVPFTLQFLFTMLAGLLLGPVNGALAVVVYIVLGLIGLPIFTQGGGPGYIFQPSFGYIIGFAVAAYVNGKIATVYKGNIIKNLIMDCQSYTKYRPNETTGGIFVSWRRKEELPTGA
jgi:biotin transport system substrate-specific component